MKIIKFTGREQARCPSFTPNKSVSEKQGDSTMKKLIVMLILLGSVGMPVVGFGRQTLNDCLLVAGGGAAAVGTAALRFLPIQLSGPPGAGAAMIHSAVAANDQSIGAGNDQIFYFCKAYRRRAAGPGSALIPVYAAGYSPYRGEVSWVAYSIDINKLGTINQVNGLVRPTAFHMSQDLEFLGLQEASSSNLTYPITCNQTLGGPPAVGTAAPLTQALFARGHMLPAGNANYDSSAQDMTFSFMNVVPQNPSLNSGAWGALEGQLRTLVTGAPAFVPAVDNRVYVIDGSYGTAYSQTQVVGPPTNCVTDKVGQTGAAGAGVNENNQITIPACFFKIIYDPHQDETVAFLFPNESTKWLLPWANNPFGGAPPNVPIRTAAGGGGANPNNWINYAIRVDDLMWRMQHARMDVTQNQYNLFDFFPLAAAPAVSKLWPASGIVGAYPTYHRLATLGSPGIRNIGAFGAPPGMATIWYQNTTAATATLRMRPYPYGRRPAAGPMLFPGC